MIVFSSLQIRRGVRVLLDNATATINPGQKVGLVGKNGCGKSTLLALLKNEISADGGSYTFPGSWQLAWVNQETPALPQAALEYVIDGDREYRQLEAQLHDANERNDGHAIATIHGKLDAIDAWSIRSRAASLLHGLGFSNEQLERPVSDLLFDMNNFINDRIEEVAVVRDQDQRALIALQPFFQPDNGIEIEVVSRFV